jgi:hypothetical protein
MFKVECWWVLKTWLLIQLSLNYNIVLIILSYMAYRPILVNKVWITDLHNVDSN